MVTTDTIVQPPRSAPKPGDSADRAPADTPAVLARFRSELDLVDLNARQLMRRLAATAVTLDDLQSFGHEGLLHASRSFDEARGVPFRRWANLRIRGAMIDGVRKWGQLPRRVYRELRAIEAADHVQAAYDEDNAAPTAAGAAEADARLSAHLAELATAMALGTMARTSRDLAEAPDDEPSPEELVSERELLVRVKAIVSGLPDTERTLLERHYFDDLTLDQAAASLGLSKSWGSRLHARAIEAIARALRRR